MDKIINKALFTCGTNGIGKASACELSQIGLNSTIVGQTSEKSDLVAKQIRVVTGNRIARIAADLSNLNGIKHTVTTYKEKHSNLKKLINNAGAFFNQRIIPEDGHDKISALNHQIYFCLSHLLVDLPRYSSPSRIINVSSLAHTRAIHSIFDYLQGEKRYFVWDAYSRCNLLLTYELSRSFLSLTC